MTMRTPPVARRPLVFRAGDHRIAAVIATSTGTPTPHLDRPLLVAIHGGVYTSRYFDVASPGLSLLDAAPAPRRWEYADSAIETELYPLEDGLLDRYDQTVTQALSKWGAEGWELAQSLAWRDVVAHDCFAAALRAPRWWPFAAAGRRFAPGASPNSAARRRRMVRFARRVPAS